MCFFLQKLNHQSRAYCVKSEGLPGFLISLPHNFNTFSEHTKLMVRKSNNLNLDKLTDGVIKVTMFGVEGKYIG